MLRLPENRKTPPKKVLLSEGGKQPLSFSSLSRPAQGGWTTADSPSVDTARLWGRGWGKGYEYSARWDLGR